MKGEKLIIEKSNEIISNFLNELNKMIKNGNKKLKNTINLHPEMLLFVNEDSGDEEISCFFYFQEDYLMSLVVITNGLSNLS